MNILVTGGSGQVGLALGRLPWPEDVRLHAPPRTALDLSDPASIRRALDGERWSAVISCGAFTAVDRAETDVEAAWAANALAPAILARGAALAGAPIVHVSTDYVFPGTKSEPYQENDPVGPVGVYGASKEGGEQAVRTANPRHAVVRTAWVVSPDRANFLRTMLRLATERDEVRVVDDQRGSPTFARDLAQALQRITLRLARDPGAPVGTYHAVNSGEATWAGFAREIFATSARHGGPSARVVPISTAEYPTPARRPANSRLATDRIRADHGVALRPWQEALDETVAELLSGSVSAPPGRS